ncbi:MAG: hypothetical protein RMM06_07835 [Armatimonadota bacterium]|nr:hypothetical protein [Armatimonadota bacterium]
MRKALAMLSGLAVALLVGCGGGEETLPPDSTPPIIGTPAITREAGTNRVQVRVQVFDTGTGVAAVTALVVGTDPTPAPVPLQQVAGTEEYQVTLPVGTVRLQVRAVDRRGNEATSPDIRVPPPQPPF